MGAPEATHEERKAFVLEVLKKADLGENRILRIKPRAQSTLRHTVADD